MAINKTAFGVPKNANDISQIRVLFTFDVPDALCEITEKINGTIFEREKTDDALYVRSVDGELVCESGPNNGDVSIIHTKRHPRLQPNRGILFSPSAFCDTWLSDTQEIEYGLFNYDELTLQITNGITVAYKGGKLYARVYSLGVRHYNVEISQTRIKELDGRALGDEFNAAWGHLLDIQGQWRGVGDLNWFLSSPYDNESQHLHNYPALNRRDKLTVANPALHAGFIARNLGTVARVRSGCMDVSSEGGTSEEQIPVQVKTATVKNVSVGGTVLLVFRVPYDFKGQLNTRDIQLYRFTADSTGKSDLRVWLLRDSSRLTKTVGGVPNLPILETDWTKEPRPGSSLEYIDNSLGILGVPANGFITAFNKTDISDFIRFPLAANVVQPFELPDPERIPEWMTHGAVCVVEGYGTNADMRVYSFCGEVI